MRHSHIYEGLASQKRFLAPRAELPWDLVIFNLQNIKIKIKEVSLMVVLDAFRKIKLKTTKIN